MGNQNLHVRDWCHGGRLFSTLRLQGGTKVLLETKSDWQNQSDAIHWSFSLRMTTVCHLARVKEQSLRFLLLAVVSSLSLLLRGPHTVMAFLRRNNARISAGRQSPVRLVFLEGQQVFGKRSDDVSLSFAIECLLARNCKSATSFASTMLDHVPLLGYAKSPNPHICEALVCSKRSRDAETDQRLEMSISCQQGYLYMTSTVVM